MNEQDIFYCSRYKDVGEALVEALESVAKTVRFARVSSDLRQAQARLKFCLRSLEREEKQYQYTLLAYMHGRYRKECGFHGFEFKNYCSHCVEAKDTAAIQ